MKDIFYFPQQILNYHGKKFYSIVAINETEKVVGHFAMLKADDSNIAEVGIVVVDPKFKGMGIMDRMFDLAIEIAGKTGLDALFGEAIMYHPFSQKSNIRHNFIESALQFGRIPSDVKLNGATINHNNERGSVLLAYKLLKEQKKSLYLPELYKEMILATYNQTDMITAEYKEKGKGGAKISGLSYVFDPVSNIATIIINSYADDFIHKFHLLLHHIQSKHCHMVYADINLETIPEIDRVTELLNKELFFYAGIHFLKHHNQDYLQLQYKHSNIVGRKNSVCYSDFCISLYSYILDDQKRVKNLQ